MTKDGVLDLNRQGIGNISQIEGLEKLAGLRVLDLEQNQIFEIEEIEWPASLQRINLRGNLLYGIERLWGLGKLTNLKRLDLRDNNIAWPASLSEKSPVQEILAHCRKAAEEKHEPQRNLADAARQKAETDQQEEGALDRARVEKLKKLVNVSTKLKIAQVGEYLGLAGKALFDRLVDWAAEFGFTLDEDTVNFGGGRKDDFLAQLDKEFANWSATSKKE